MEVDTYVYIYIMRSRDVFNGFCTVVRIDRIDTGE